jgi:RND superfamily putative drug exporter
MSTFLYTLGHRIARHRWKVLVTWCLVAAAALAVAGLTGGQLVNDYAIPGTESQRGIDTLAQRFPQASGTTGQIVFTSTGGPIADQQPAVEQQIQAIAKVQHVTSVDDPFASDAVGTISPDKLNALSSIQFDVPQADLPPEVVPAVEAAAKPPPEAKFTVTLGGAMYPQPTLGIGITEVLGVLLAFAVLAITFASLLAAGLPLVTAALGVGITLSGVLTVASVATISTTTPTLALMIGLAVGIDYGLFIVTRHRRQLATGTSVPESIAQASATAGSAVVFAGTTVIIALCGLAVAQIPFLSVMGYAAAVGVAVAVLAALTLLPAVLSLCGERLRPKPASRVVRISHRAAEGRTLGARWVGIATKVPVATVLVVLAAIGIMAIPAKDLALALPDNGSSVEGSPQRVTYDLVSTEFGPGYNSPLLVTANIITSTDPKGTVSSLANDIAAIPGVLAVTKQTPNQTADLGLVRIVPQWGQSDPRTTDLVQRLRAQAPTWEQQLSVTDILVTGQTAVAIDVSDQLSAALVPFGIVVVGLSLILLAIVFRSIAVPIKATLGYLLSIGAALGAVTATCMWGWLAGPLHITYIGPLVSFFPIILMGVLFGLAMDYEVFLVSQIREDFVHTGDARHAIRTGFIGSARVVTAAAIIMISVFAAFIPDGSATIKPIAIGLTTGVFVDAFLVRMTLVPAVLALLGRHAWWIPRTVDRALPSIDVEGQALLKHVEQAEWDEVHPGVAVRAEQLLLASSEGPVVTDLQVPMGSVWTVEHDDPRWRSALVWTIAGWRKPDAGRLGVLGCVLPEESGAVRKKVRVVPSSSGDEDGLTVREYLRSVLVAQSRHPWSPGDGVEQALELAEAWLQPLTEPMSRTEARLEDRRLGQLGAIERQLVALSAAATQDPELIVVQDADAGLGAVEMSWFVGVCHEIVEASDTTVVLVGQRVGVEVDGSPEPEPATVGDGKTPATTRIPTPPPSDPSPVGTDGVPVDEAGSMSPRSGAGEPEPAVHAEGERA